MAKELSIITCRKGNFLGQLEENPRETCKCITHMLRSGTAYQESRMPDLTLYKTQAEPPHSDEYEPHQSEAPIIEAQTSLMEE